MKSEKIKPIPKNILQKIKRLDKIDYKTPSGHTRFYAYLAKNDNELVKITVAVKNKYSKWYYKQCAIHGIHSEKCFVKDMCFTYIAGYSVGWHSEGLTEYSKWYEDSQWGFADDKYFDVYAPIVNIEYLDRFPKYKYSAVKLYSGTKLLQYLRLYERFPQIEYLMKSGLFNIAQSKVILKRVGKDKKFCKWLMRNREIIQNTRFYIDIIIKAYISGKDINLLQREKSLKLKFAHNDYYKSLQNRFNTEIMKKLTKYLIDKNINVSSYTDYLYACDYLHIDLSKDKNLFPHDFQRWHDIRADEYRSAKAIVDEQKRAELYNNFKTVAEKYLPLQKMDKCNYIVVIAHNPSELVKEGELLQHCVGRMGYDQKFAREETLIFFLRKVESPDTPFVTLEYSPTKKKILQCYGYKDSKPDETVNQFVYKKWLPFANKKIKKITQVA